MGVDIRKMPHYEVDHEWGYGIAFELKAKSPVEPKVMEEMVTAVMKETADECMRLGALMIGHIKCILHTETGYVKSDTIGTKYGVNTHSELTRPEREGILVINTIVVGLDKNKIVEVTKAVAVDVTSRFGFEPRILEKKGMT